MRGREFEARVRPALEMTAEEIRAWESLCLRHPHLASPFLSPHYAMAAARAGCRVRVCVIRNGGQAIAFLPFQFRTGLHRLAGAADRVGEEMSDYFGLIGEPEFRVAPRRLLDLSGLQHLNFSHLEESQLEHGLTGEQPEQAYLMRFTSGADYWNEVKTAHKEFVKKTDRAWRQLEAERGRMEFRAEVAEGAELDRVLAEKTAQFRKTGRPDLFAVGWKRRLVGELARVQAPSCTGILSTLYAGETWVASHFGLRSERVLHYWFPVYNAELGKYSPGRLLLKALIGHAPSMGITTLDHGAGEAWYKQESSNAVHTLYRGAWHKPGPRSWACRAMESARWRWEKLVTA